MVEKITTDKGQRGLVYTIKCIQRTIEIMKGLGKDTKLEEKLVKSYLKYLPEHTQISLRAKSGRLK